MMRYILATLCAGVLALANNSLIAQEAQPVRTSVKPILGMVVVGQTTLNAFEKELELRNCTFDQSPKFIDKAYVVVHNGCFDLPGSPVIRAESDGASDKPIVELSLTFKNQVTTPYSFYEKVLMKSHGTPTITLDADNIKGAAWYWPDEQLISIVGNMGANHQTLSILYESGKGAKAHWKQLSDEWNPQPTSDTDLL